MKIAFLGTPEFAVPSLMALHEAGHALTVFTQPDRPRGRRMQLAPPPVKTAALGLGLPVFQYENISGGQGLSRLQAISPDLMVTAAWGQILSPPVLAVPRLGCLNVHGSLLPRYRGAAPVQWAILNGEKVTGVTIMRTDAGLDTGDMLARAETAIGPEETAGELLTRLAPLGAALLVRTVAAWQGGEITPIPQDNALATQAPQLNKEDGKLDFAQPALSLHNRVRGLNPWPGAYALLEDIQVKFWRTAAAPLDRPAVPGQCVVADPRQGLLVATGEGALQVLELQFPGAKRMEAGAALLGRPLAGRRFS